MRFLNFTVLFVSLVASSCFAQISFEAAAPLGDTSMAINEKTGEVLALQNETGATWLYSNGNWVLIDIDGPVCRWARVAFDPTSNTFIAVVDPRSYGRTGVETWEFQGRRRKYIGDPPTKNRKQPHLLPILVYSPERRNVLAISSINGKMRAHEHVDGFWRELDTSKAEYIYNGYILDGLFNARRNKIVVLIESSYKSGKLISLEQGGWSVVAEYSFDRRDNGHFLGILNNSSSDELVAVVAGEDQFGQYFEFWDLIHGRLDQRDSSRRYFADKLTGSYYWDSVRGYDFYSQGIGESSGVVDSALCQFILFNANNAVIFTFDSQKLTTKQYLPFSFRNKIYLFFDPISGNEMALLDSPPWMMMHEKGVWKSVKNNIGDYLGKAVYIDNIAHVTSGDGRTNLILKMTDSRGNVHYDPVVITLSWNGYSWVEQSPPKHVLNAFSQGKLSLSPGGNSMIYVSVYNDTIWMHSSEGWEPSIYKVFEERQYLFDVTYDYIEELPMVIINDYDDRIYNKYILGGKAESFRASKRKTFFSFRSQAAYSFPGQRPGFYSLSRSPGNTKLMRLRFFQWTGKNWINDVSLPLRVSVPQTSFSFISSYFSSRRANVDSIQGHILGVQGYNGEVGMWHIGPFPGPASGGRDFNGDGRDDMVTYNNLDRSWSSSDVDQRTIYADHGVPFTADLDGDGKAGRGIFLPLTGTWRIEGGRAKVQFGKLGDLPVVGDYDGDGKDDLVLFRRATGEWLNKNRTLAVVGDRHSTAVPGDYNGDGKVEPAVYNAYSGTWTFVDGSTVKLGGLDQLPAPADYDGDGKTDIVVWDRSSGKWKTVNGVMARFGYAGDFPAPGDYDGDGKAEPCLYRPGSGEWLIDGVVVHKTAKWSTPVW